LENLVLKGINERKTYEEIIKIHPDQKVVIASGYAKSKGCTLLRDWELEST